MTVKEYNANLDRFLVDITKINRPLYLAAKSSVQQIGNRIFQDGKKTNERIIGQYDTNHPLYVNPNNSPKSFKPEGKPVTVGKVKRGNKKGQDIELRNTVRLVGKEVVEHKTRWFANYKDFRNQIGRPIDKVNLVLSGDLQSDFRKANVNQFAEPTKISPSKYVIQLDRVVNEKKSEGFDKKYGEIFTASQKEKETFERNVNLELNNELEKYGLL